MMNNKRCSSRRTDISKTIAQLNLRKSEDIYRTLKKAIDADDYFMVKSILQVCVKIENLKEDSRTLIHYAVEKRKFRLIELLFSFCDTDVNYTDKNGLSHFHAACIIGNFKLVNHYISRGVDINLRFNSDTDDHRNSFTPLHFAVSHAKVKTVKLLLENGADINATDSFNRTPLHLACCIPEIVGDLILSFDYNKRILNCQNDMLQIVDLLIRRKSDINARDRIGNTPIYYIFHDETWHYMDKYYSRDTLEFRIVNEEFTKKKFKITKKLRIQQKWKLQHLLEKRADITTRNDVHDTILHQAVKYLIPSRQLHELKELYFDDSIIAEMITLILKHGTDVNAINQVGQTPLQIAISVLSAEVFSVLLEYGADINSIKFDYKDNNYFYYPNIIPCFEATENLLYIINTLESKGYNFSHLDNLAILKFFIINNNGCYYASPDDENALYKLKNLFEFGSDFNIVNKIADVTRGESFSKGMLSNAASKHLMKLECMSEQSCLHKGVEDVLSSYISSDEFSNFLQSKEHSKLKEECIKMQNTKLNNNISLKEIIEIYSNNDKFCLSLINSNYREILRSDEFCSNYHLLGDMIKGYFAKSLIRRYIFKSASDYLRILTNICLPDHCCESISCYLNNEDLWNLCLSITLNTNDDASISLANDILTLKV